MNVTRGLALTAKEIAFFKMVRKSHYKDGDLLAPELIGVHPKSPQYKEIRTYIDKGLIDTIRPGAVYTSVNELLQANLDPRYFYFHYGQFWNLIVPKPVMNFIIGHAPEDIQEAENAEEPVTRIVFTLHGTFSENPAK